MSAGWIQREFERARQRFVDCPGRPRVVTTKSPVSGLPRQYAPPIEDDLSRFIAQQEIASPEYRAAREDLQIVHKVLDELVARRTASGATAAEVAKQIGITELELFKFESELSDPNLLVLLRYARAVDARVSVIVVSGADG